MQKGVRLSSIIFIPLLVIAMLVTLIVSIVFFVASAAPDEVFIEAGASTAEEIAAARGLAAGTAGSALVWVFILVAGLVIDIILLAKSKAPYGRAAMIVLGVFGIITGPFVPGILNIVWAAKSRGEAPAAPAE